VEEKGKCVLEELESGEIYVDTRLELVLPALPSGLLVKPALIWKIKKSKAESVVVSYLSDGFSREANYVAEIKKSGLSLTSWAEIENNSGATFQDAKIKLIAGDVKRVTQFYQSNAGLQVCEESQPFSEKEFFDYHLYTLNHPTTIKNNQKKQIQLFNGSDIAYEKYYDIRSFSDKPDVMIEFENTVNNGLGIPFPKGVFRLYQRDESDQSLEFIGEDEIDHSPVDKMIRINVGGALDVESRYRELSRRKQKGMVIVKDSYEIINHKSEAIHIRVEHSMEDVHWKMLNTSHPYEVKSSDRIKFSSTVPEKNTLTIEFEYQMDKTIRFLIDQNTNG
jgi:hypothetical protein